MRTTKLGAVLATFAITTGTAALLAETPAQSDTPAATTAKLAIDQHTTVVGQYGDLIGYLEINISDVNGGGVYTGSADLQQRLPGKSWATVKTDNDGTNGINFGSYGSHDKGNLKYRIHYLGGTDANTSITYAPSYSNVVTVRTLWNLHEDGTCVGGCRFFGKLSPNARHHKVLIQVKHGSWKKYKVVKTDSRSHWNARVVATFGNGTYYRAVVGRTKREIKTTSHVYRFYKIRTS
jgi:hypothetical protein